MDDRASILPAAFRIIQIEIQLQVNMVMNTDAHCHAACTIWHQTDLGMVRTQFADKIVSQNNPRRITFKSANYLPAIFAATLVHGDMDYPISYTCLQIITNHTYVGIYSVANLRIQEMPRLNVVALDTLSKHFLLSVSPS